MPSSPKPRPQALAPLVLLAALAAGPGVASAPPVVPGFERFFAGPKADAARGGALLMGELGCVNCHRAEGPAAARLATKRGPVLDGVGSRVRRSFLRKFLTNPAAARPGTTMPQLLAGLSNQETEQRAEALVHFLASTGPFEQERPEQKLAAGGRELYHRAGCVACHGTRDARGNEAKTLPTSVPLGDLKAKYAIKGLAAFLADPLHVRPSGRMPALLTRDESRAVANYLLQGAPYDAPPPNMTYTYFEGDWERLPDFDGLRPRRSGQSSGFDLDLARRPQHFAMRFEGHLRVDRDGEYHFHLTSDDGSKLWVGGKLVVANDGVHAANTASGTVRLTKGVHKFAAGVFNAGGPFELNVEIEGPGLGRRPVGPLVSLTPEDNPAREPKLPASEDNAPFDRGLAEKGRVLFGSLGCASCHALTVDGKRSEARPARSLAKLPPEGGCLNPSPARGLPHYPLAPRQRSALAAAVRALAAAPSERPGNGEVIARTLTAFNCYACHDRDQVGGVEEPWNALFTSTQPEMGDEGRVPPTLTGVGAKLTTGWLTRILSGGAKDRPYMHARMPSFGANTVGHLTSAFEAADRAGPVARPSFDKALSRVKADGRHMVGGQAFGCIKCHTFAGHRAEGVQGIDMTILGQRLRRDWFHRYVKEPQRYRPGTRMPEAWPKGQSLLTSVLDGDADKQIEAVWLYLSDGNKARLPVGLTWTSIPLVPGKEAIVHRGFIEGAGVRAIGVGYPEKAHLAFDAQDLRLAMVWQGAFLDAARHWTDRGSGFEGPLGDNVLHLPAGVGFAVLKREEEAWPERSAREMGYKFQGYHTTDDQRPTFLYSVGGARVEDFPTAVANKEAPSIRRELTLTADGPMENLWFRAAVGDRIEPAGEGWYRVNGEWKLRIESAAAPRLRQSGGKKELLVPVRFKDRLARIVQEIVW